MLDDEAKGVSIHAPVMGANGEDLDQLQDRYVSIHAPVMGANGLFVDYPTTNDVSIHAPVMGANPQLEQRLELGKFQSTHP